jgi:hypothetical protein
MTKEKQLNLHQKLVQIRREVEYIQKNTKGYNFKYADEDSILSAIRPKMDELNVILEFEMLEPKPINDKVCQVGFVFTWVNADQPSDKMKKSMYLQGPIGDVQKMGGLCTYANRFFLYKFFNVPTGDLDPDVRHGRITVDQLAHLEKEINGDIELRQKMLDWSQASDFSQIQPHQLPTILRTVAEHKKNKKENNG